MPQHFLLSSKARTLSLSKVLRLSDDEAFETFKEIRWADNGGKPFCPRCGCTAVYQYKTRKIFKCESCEAQFSVTTGTIFASRKMPIRNLLAAIAIFVNGAKGYSALQLSRDLDCQYKTAFVLAHKIREAIGSVNDNDKLSGEVEVDGCYVGGYIKPANFKDARIDRRLLRNRTGKRKVVVAMRERKGKTLTFIFKTENQAVPTIASKLENGTVLFADESSSWDDLHDSHEKFLTKRINHSVAYSDGQACTNQAESFFSRIRRAEIGMHHHIAGAYLHAYAEEMAWREDNRRLSNGELYLMAVNASLQHPVSRNWKGYWQRADR